MAPYRALRGWVDCARVRAQGRMRLCTMRDPVEVALCTLSVVENSRRRCQHVSTVPTRRQRTRGTAPLVAAHDLTYLMRCPCVRAPWETLHALAWRLLYSVWSTSWTIADGHLPLEGICGCAEGDKTAVRARVQPAGVRVLLHALGASKRSVIADSGK
jgi:hypothetical protein